MPWLLIVSHSSPFLSHLLQQVVTQPLHIWSLTDTGAVIPDLTEPLLQAAWNQGCFCQLDFQPQWVNHQGDHHQLLAWLQLQTEPFAIVAAPQQAIHKGDSWQLTMDLVTAAVLSQLPSPHTLAKQALQVALEALPATRPAPLPWLPLLEQCRTLAATDLDSAWNDLRGQSLRYWRHRLPAWQPWQPEARTLLTTTIRDHLADPQALGPRAVLHFFRRQPLLVTSRAQPWEDYGCGSKLQILPPPDLPHVTILVTTHNRLPWLKRAIASIQAQTFTHWQLLLGDDASVDGTQSYGQALVLQDTRIQYHGNTTQQGFQSTLTALYQAAPTELVIHCCDDDWWEPFHLQQLMDFFLAHPWVGLVASACYLAEMHTGLVKDKLCLPLAEPSVLEPMPALQQLPIKAFAGPGCLYRKSVLRELAATDPQAQHPESAAAHWPYAIWDSHILARCLARYEVGYCPQASVYLSLSEHSRTENNLGQSIGEEIEWFKQLLVDYTDRLAVGSFPVPLVVQTLQKLAGRLGKLAEQQVLIPQPLEPWLAQQRELWTQMNQLQEGLKNP